MATGPQPVIDELEGDYEALTELKQYEYALGWAKEHGKGARATCTALQGTVCPRITISGMEGRLKGRIQNGYEYADRSILTMHRGGHRTGEVALGRVEGWEAQDA